MAHLIIYFPAFNEDKTIFDVIRSTQLNFKSIDKVTHLVIDDGSTDKTVEQSLAANAMVVSHKGNKGVGTAFQTAIDYALKVKADILVSFDADGQFDAADIEKLIVPILTHKSDFVLGGRFGNGKPDKMSGIKYRGNLLVNSIISRISKSKIEDASCGFRAYSEIALLNLNLHGSFTYTHETILDLIDKGINFEQIPVRVRYFEERKSRVASNVYTYGLKTSRIIFKCFKDYAPFYFFGRLALAVLLLGLIMGGLVLWHWISTGSISPYKSIGIIGLVLVGMSLLLFTIALIADILGRLRKNQERILYHLKKQSSDTY
jgi:glycosyltransferase involved in cell wall biosynthesis